MNKKFNIKQIAFAAAVIVSLVVIGYFSLNPKQDAKTGPTISALENKITSEQPQVQENKALPEVAKPQNQTDTASNPETKADETSKTDAGIRILKSEVTSTAKFYPYKLGGTKMEVVAVKASDGTIRTAFNTCQICYRSGRGYYVQSGEYLVCQNCGNRFHLNQVEVVRGGCNPIPIMKEDKQVTGDYIVISDNYLASSADYFSRWKKA